MDWDEGGADNDIDIKNGSTSMVIAIVIVVTVLFSTFSIVYYYKTRNGKMKWEDNPNYSDSTCANEDDGNPILPNWLLGRNEMIYDTRCIEKGQQIGHGNFGTVFEGKIRLGNAVYIFSIPSVLI